MSQKYIYPILVRYLVEVSALQSPLKAELEGDIIVVIIQNKLYKNLFRMLF